MLGRTLRITVPVALFMATLVAPGVAAAHFRLQSPPSAFEQNNLGDPQKFLPCGHDGSGVPTGAVTVVQAGDTVTVTIDETIFHPGHYRIAIAENPSELPEPPPVTPVGNDPCGSTTIQDPPLFPVLADGVFAHSQRFGEPQTIEVTIPEHVSCDNCTLQVIQYMSSHAVPCFYYHCATLEVEGAAGDSTGPSGDDEGDASSGDGMTTESPTTVADTADTDGSVGDDDGATDGGTTAPTGDTDPPAGDDEAGCSCSSDASQPGHAILGLIVLVALGHRRPQRS